MDIICVGICVPMASFFILLGILQLKLTSILSVTASVSKADIYLQLVNVFHFLLV